MANPKEAPDTIQLDAPDEIQLDAAPDTLQLDSAPKATDTPAGTRFVEGVGRGLQNVAGFAKQVYSDFTGDTPVALSNKPEDQGSLADRLQGESMLGQYILQPAAHEKQRAEEERAQVKHFIPRSMEEAKHSVMAGVHDVGEYVPGIGPIVGHLADTAVNEGDVAGAAGEGLVYVAVPKVVEKGAGVVGSGLGKMGVEVPSVREVGRAVGRNRVTGPVVERLANGLGRINVAAEAPEVPAEDIVLSPEGKQLDARQERVLQDIERQSTNNPVRRPGDIAPEVINPNATTQEEPLLSTPVVRGGQQELPAGGVMGKMLALPAAPEAAVSEPEVGSLAKPEAELPVGRVDTLPPEEKASPVTPKQQIDRAGKLIEEGLGGRPLESNKPLREQVPSPKKNAETEHNKQQVNANGENLANAIPATPKGKALLEKFHDLSNTELRQLAINAGEDMGQKTVGRKKLMGEGQMTRPEVFDRLLKNHTPEELGKMVDEGKHLPPVSGGSQGARATENEATIKKQAESGTTPVNRDPVQMLQRWGVDTSSLAKTDAQVRGWSAAKSKAYVDSLVDTYKRGKEVEPIIEIRDADNNIIDVDGRHRALAAAKAGLKQIPVIVKRP